MQITIRVPATTANLGPGFDCFGCALAMYNTLRFTEQENGFSFVGFEEIYANEDDLAVTGYRAAMERMGLSPMGLRIEIETGIPICRGLGSSSSLIAAGALAANAFHGSPLSREELLEVCNRIEGHPDNLAPAIFGGLTASMLVDGKPVMVRCPIHPRVHFVALIPDFEFSTRKARAALPKTLTYQDAVFNVSHGAILLRALEAGDERLIAMAMADRFHEPYRKPLIAGSDVAEQAARSCGALAFVLSGAGPTFLCVTTDPSFAEKVRESLAKLLPAWSVTPLPVDQQGATVEEREI
ncbi:MAG: homoserine kinase [Oscillospiraceae bacterium]|nr:homoserine kinase [Oscillospiraceae bacterium]